MPVQRGQARPTGPTVIQTASRDTYGVRLVHAEPQLGSDVRVAAVGWNG